jgi:HAE1 family hydrophobic/amphiphilic exporter-1
MTTLITASLIAFGLFGYRLLAVAALPAVDFATIQITATLPGASPETMGASVAGPIERALSAIAGITSLTSTSALGERRPKLIQDAAAARVRRRIRMRRSKTRPA